MFDTLERFFRIKRKKYPNSGVSLDGVLALSLLLVLSLAAVVYHLIRIRFSGAVDFSIDWNLFLSWIPLLIAFGGRIHSRRFPNQYPGTILFSVLWLLFFPNAPYMVTDLVHLSVDYGRNLTWHDTVMLYYYAQVSLINGLVSLYWIHTTWRVVFGKRAGNLLLWISLPIAGFGVYLGRVQRWNSWDIIHQPKEFLPGIFDSLNGKTALLISFEFALLIGILYLMLWILLRYRRRLDNT